MAPPCVWQTHRRLSLRPLQSIAAAGTGADAGEAGGGGGHRAAGSRTQAPWTLTFDLKERDTQWTEENQARLVRIVAGYQLNLATEEVERRLDELSVLLPQVAVRCAYIKPSTLAELLRDPAALVARLLQLRQLMPGADISALAAAEPELLLLRDVAAIQADLARLRQLLGDGAEIDGLVQQQPQFLDAQLVRCAGQRQGPACTQVPAGRTTANPCEPFVAVGYS